MTRELDRIMERVKKNLIRTDAEVDAWEGKIDDIHKACEDVKKTIAKELDEPEQLFFSFMPHRLSRVSPFFPINRKVIRYRETDIMTIEGPWGTLTIKGERLSVFDESVLLAVLHVMMRQKNHTIKTKRLELCRIIGIEPQKRVYQNIVESLLRMSETFITLRDKKGNPIMWNHILSGGILEENGEDMLITIDEYFLNMYTAGLINNISMQFRNSLKGDFSKLLYRFWNSHSGDTCTHPVLIVANSINIDLSLSDKEIKERIRSGMTELKKKGFLEKRSHIKNDKVYAYKLPEYRKAKIAGK